MFSRRVHYRLTAITLLITCMFTTGCSFAIGYGFDTDEWVDIPNPESVAVNDQGELMLAVHIERDFQSTRSGWHWITIDGAALNISQSSIAGFDPEPIELRWEGEVTNARMEPPLLSAGLASADPALVGAVPTGAYTIEMIRRGPDFYLASADAPSQVRKLYTIEPGGKNYAPPIRHAIHGAAFHAATVVDMVAFVPVFAVAHALTETIERIRD